LEEEENELEEEEEDVLLTFKELSRMTAQLRLARSTVLKNGDRRTDFWTD